MKVFYECDCKACEKCDYLHCAATSDIKHAKNFIKKDDVYFERTSIDCFDLPHQHACEIKLFHDNKFYWRSYCVRKKKPNKHFYAGMEDECMRCPYAITIMFENDGLKIFKICRSEYELSENKN